MHLVGVSAAASAKLVMSEMNRLADLTYSGFDIQAFGERTR